MRRKLRPRRVWFYALLLLGGTALVWFAMLLGIDVLLGGGSGAVADAPRSGSSWGWLGYRNAGEVQAALGNLPEVVVAVLGIAITVVSIIVQLSATRYTPRVTELFFRDRTNLLVLGFFVVTSIHCIWATSVVRESFVPRVLTLSTMLMITAAVLMLVPYFIYVFAFLDPERVVVRLQDHALAEALAGGGQDPSGEAVTLAQARVLEGVEQLADVAVNAISQKDRIIASRCVDALRDLACRYMEKKAGVDRGWFSVGPDLQANPDFLVMARERVAEMGSARTWLEWKILRQYQTIYNESLNRMRDVSELVGIHTRYIAQTAMTRGDRAVWNLSVKFFNTYLRATINRADVRSAYNALHQYRKLAERAVGSAWSDEVLRVAGYFRYYGQLANTAGQSFVIETVAHDLCRLCELAHEKGYEQEEALLHVLLEVDKAPETEAEERSLRGVRKAQIKLATYYLEVGAESLARLIWRDMEAERPERLTSLRSEMLAVEDVDFWEVIDRGYNFDYLTPSRRNQLERFYAWFDLGEVSS